MPDGDERLHRVVDLRGRELRSEPDATREPRLPLAELGSDTRDLSQRDLVGERPLQVSASPRCLLRMQPVKHERRLDAVAVGHVEQACPELVVLGLSVRSVVAESVPLEDVAFQQNGVVEDRRAEERAPAHRRAPGVVQVEIQRAPVGIDVEHPRAHDRETRARLQQLHALLEPASERDVVRVHACDIATAGLVERAVQRPCEAELLLVAEHTKPRISERGERLRRLVGRGVVHDEHLDVGDRLAKDARERGPHVGLAVVHGDEDGDE